MLAARIAPTAHLTKSRYTVSLTFKRFLNAPSSRPQAETHDAFLEPVEGRPGVSYLSLNRPKSKNAISVRMVEQIKEALEEVQNDTSLRTLIVRSTTPGHFALAQTSSNDDPWINVLSTNSSPTCVPHSPLSKSLPFLLLLRLTDLRLEAASRWHCAATCELQDPLLRKLGYQRRGWGSSLVRAGPNVPHVYSACHVPKR
ncbi:enoyl-CoA hydratase/isomerase family protein [Ceratobasidium sp. AG-Ba]|nr:enoyl-CoA hydratase/isomerase family protein [Ceratobasidium sp. AG-Ba]